MMGSHGVHVLLILSSIGVVLVPGCATGAGGGGGGGTVQEGGNDNGNDNENNNGNGNQNDGDAAGHPDVASTSPADEATGVALGTEIVITFVKAADPDSIDGDIDPEVGFDWAWLAGDTVLVATPTAVLLPGTMYTVTISALSFADGSTLSDPFSFSFTTTGSVADDDDDNTNDNRDDDEPSGSPTCAIFPADNPWNTDISGYPVHENSDAYVDSIGRDEPLHPEFGTVWEGDPIGLPYVLVSGDQPLVPVSFDYADESDPGPYPIPPDAPIEAGSDHHVLVIDDDNCVLYELFDANQVDGGASWTAGSGAIFDLNSNELRPDYWTSADAAGLPVFPGLVRYDEVVEAKEINHAVRFTVEHTQAGFIHPATHFASDSTDPDLPPMGLRLRMKASYDCSDYSDEVQVICAALKKYGMIVADHGANWFITGAPDSRWNDENLADLREITGDAFEAVYTGEIVAD